MRIPEIKIVERTMKSEMKESAPIHSLEQTTVCCFPFTFCHIVATLGPRFFEVLLPVTCSNASGLPQNSHCLDSDHDTNMRLSHMFGNNLPKSSGYGILSVMLTTRKNATPQPPAAWRTFDAGLSAWCEYKRILWCSVSMWEQSTWTSWVHTNHWYPKHQKKSQKNQKTLSKLMLTTHFSKRHANKRQLSRTGHDFPIIFGKKHTLRPFFWGLTKNNNGKKKLAKKTKIPFARGAANRRASRCCQGFWARR